ncbi:thiol reductase thioredoxin [Bacteroidia bacterium]|nr:thiol reductase thioredoxin [Bacteroidia bacterium]
MFSRDEISQTVEHYIEGLQLPGHPAGLYMPVDYALKGGGAKKSAPASPTVTVLSDADFRERIYDYVKSPDHWLYKGDKVAVIDFYADWCGPCRQISPYLEELAGEYAGKVAVCKINIDNDNQTAKFFGIQSIPLVMIIPVKGDPITLLGSRAKSEYREAIETALK